MSEADQSKKDEKKRTIKGPKPKTSEEILSGFHKLRSEQRLLSSKLTEMELEEHEHGIVLDTLQGLDGKRKCFRMIGGVLCERTVSEVILALQVNLEQIKKVVKSLNEQLVAKGVEINSYKDEHNVKIKGINELNQENETKTANADGGGGSSSSSGGVLVS